MSSHILTSLPVNRSIAHSWWAVVMSGEPNGNRTEHRLA
ncbi:hypothetical protein CCP3SC5AM1_490012 [Gammaproteobacteria bacterium]